MALPCGTFNPSYEKDMAIVRTKLQWALLIGGLVLLFTFPLFAPTSITLIGDPIVLAIIVGYTAIALLGLNILTGYAGQISLGQLAFMAVGGYTSAILCTRVGLSFWIALPCASIAAALLGGVFAIPALRIKGFYLAMATLAAHFIIIYFIYFFRDYTGGGTGMSVPYPRLPWFLGGAEIDSDHRFYYLVMAILVVMTFFASNIARTKLGRNFVAIRDNDVTSSVMGINLFRNKLIAFLICSFYAGVAGSLYVHYFAYISPEYFRLWTAIWYLGMIIIGGIGSNLGSILGAVFLGLLDRIALFIGPLMKGAFPWAVGTGESAAVAMILYGLAVALFLIYEPRGLAHRWEIFKATYRVWPFSFSGAR